MAQAPETPLAQLIARVRARANENHPPKLETLLGDCALLMVAALEHQRSWTDKSGEECSRPEPDYKAATAIIRLQAELCGYLNQEKIEVERMVEALRKRGVLVKES